MTVSRYILETVDELPKNMREDYFSAAMTAQWPSISNNRGSLRITNLTRLVHNYRTILTLTNKEVIAIVKARAYGSGLLPTSLALYSEGCRAFAVATPGAAVALRQSLLNEGDTGASILILGYLPPDLISIAKQYNLTVTVTDKDLWPEYKAELAKLAAGGGPNVSFQINVDTGMTRVGIIAWKGSRPSMVAVANLAEEISSTATAHLEGIYTHFPLAGSNDRPGTPKYKFTLNQIGTLKEIVKLIKARGIRCEMVHLANSPGLQSYPAAHDESWITHVRPGQLLYGVSRRYPSKFKPISRWVTSLTRVEKMKRDTGVGYSHKGKAKKGDYIGTLAVGYADGYRNIVKRGGAKNIHWVRLKGVDLPIVGDVAMDMCMVNLNAYVKKYGSPPDPRTGDWVELVSDGRSSDKLSADSVANRMGTRWTRLLANISTRNELFVN